MTEAYCRIREKIESGELIENMPAYLNRFCFNIIREHKKKQQKHEDYVRSYPKNTNDLIINCLRENRVNDDRVIFVIDAFKQLSNEERKILRLRIVKGLPWNEISEYLSDRKKIKIKVSTLRQKGKRALERLRQAYVSVEQLYCL